MRIPVRNWIVFRSTRRLIVFWFLATLSILAPSERILLAQKDGVPKPLPSRSALADDEVNQLLLLMDTNQNGKVSKEEWMKFMEEEFDRLDTKKTRELDPKELAKSRLYPRPFVTVGR